MKTLLLTGPIGSGKSAVSALLRERGVAVYDSDSRAKLLYETDPELLPAVEKALGRSFRRRGVFSRKALSNVVFSDPEKLSILEGVVHPVVRKDFLRWRDGISYPSWPHGAGPFVVMESAIALSKPLFRDLFDGVIMVEAPLEERVRRIVARDGVSEEEALRRISLQNFDPSLADLLIVNDASPDDLIPKVEFILSKGISHKEP